MRCRVVQLGGFVGCSRYPTDPFASATVFRFSGNRPADVRAAAPAPWD